MWREKMTSLRTLPTASVRAFRVRRPEMKRGETLGSPAPRGKLVAHLVVQYARVAKLVDAAVFKTEAVRGNCGFESRHGHAKCSKRYFDPPCGSGGFFLGFFVAILGSGGVSSILVRT